MKRALKQISVITMLCGATGIVFQAEAQTNTGKFTINMPHGRVMMDIGRVKSPVNESKSQVRQERKIEKPDSPDESATAVAGAYSNVEYTDKPNSQSSGSAIVYDANEKALKYGGRIYKFVPVNYCTFKMGATEEQGAEAETSESPSHRVTLFTYWLGSTEVPQWLWTAVMGNNPSQNEGEDYPVENVSWNDCVEFTDRLSELTGKAIVLPTEAQMELALRNGKNDNPYKYGTPHALDDVAWYADNSDGRTHQVALKKPNDLGLYDMIGNVGEWCQDWFGEYSTEKEMMTTGAESGTRKVYRSATYNSKAKDCRTSTRFAEAPLSKSPSIGLRLALK